MGTQGSSGAFAIRTAAPGGAETTHLPPNAGMEVYPARTQLPELLPQPVLAGVIGGICFLSVAIIFSTTAACIMNRRRAARIRKRQRGNEPHGGVGRGISRGGGGLWAVCAPLSSHRRVSSPPVVFSWPPDPPLVFSPRKKLPAAQ